MELEGQGREEEGHARGWLTSSERTFGMKNTVSLEGAINFTNLSVRLVCVWPPSRRCNKSTLMRADIICGISFLSVFCLFVSLLMAIYEYRDDSIIVTQTICFCLACAMINIKSILLRINRRKLQTLIRGMEEFVKNCRFWERQVLQRYVNNCWIYHGVVSFMNYLAATLLIVSPFVIPDQKMPTAAVYPFSIDSGLPMYLAFLHQSIVGLQTSAGLTVDCQLAMTMWFAGARLEMLAEEIGTTHGIRDFRSFIKKHQKLLAYATEVSSIMCYIAFTTTCVCGVAAIICCVQLVGNDPLIIKLRYGPAAIVGLTNLMICAWPTENISRVSDLIGESIYNTPWFDMSPKLMRDLIMILRSTQRPVQVSVAGFLPALSFRFYASFLSGVFSYFTTLRVIMSDDGA